MQLIGDFVASRSPSGAEEGGKTDSARPPARHSGVSPEVKGRRPRKSGTTVNPPGPRPTVLQTSEEMNGILFAFKVPIWGTV